MANLTPGFITAMCKAAQRANTTAGWRSTTPFFAMAGSPALQILDADEDCEEELPFVEPPALGEEDV